MPDAAPPSTGRHADPRVRRVIEAFERLAPADVASLDGLYVPDARFKDPFNEVRGLPAIQRIFDHMFVALEAPRFEIRDVVAEGDQCFLTWDFRLQVEALPARPAAHPRRLAPSLRTRRPHRRTP
jgi:ketosteroid isomerase-like protein